MDKKTKVSILQRASKLGNTKELQDILKDPEIQECINRRTGAQKQTALHVACHENQKATVEILLQEKTITIDALDGRNWTPLCYAADTGNPKIVMKLIAKGANVKHVLNNGDSPLHIAAMKSNVSVCEILLENGANINAANHNFWTPLHVASGEGDEELVQLFTQQNVDVNKQTVYGDTASNMAARNDNELILKLLKFKKADFDLANTNGEAPVHSAAMGGHVLTLKYLLDNKANPMACAKNGLTVFHFAAKNGHSDIFNMLHEKMPKKDFQKLLNEHTESLKGMWISTIGCGIILSNVAPIHLASLEGHSAVVKTLIKYGANKEDIDANKHTAKDLLEQYKAQFQVWDIDRVAAVTEVLESYTVGNLQKEDSPRAYATNANYFDSDYYSTSSVTTEDVESNIDDLEDHLKELETGRTSAKYVKRKKRALKKKIERSGLSSGEKSEIYSKLETIEKVLEKLTIEGLPQTQETTIVKGMASKNSDKIAQRFRANFTTLQRELESEDHIHYLFQQGALEISDIEKIQSKQTEEEKVTTLLYALFAKPDKNWTVAFVESLESCEKTTHLAALLTE